MGDTPNDIQTVVGILKKGGLVAVPTETVYGLAADALNPNACRKIFDIKGRPLIDPLIVHVYSRDQVETLAHWSTAAQRLAAAFWPGPLTLVLPKKAAVSDIVTAGRPAVAIRMPRHPFLRKVLKVGRLPLAAPSANPFGYLSPTQARHVCASLGSRIPYILDGGPCSIGLESTIVDLSTPGHPQLLRPGPITAEAITDILETPPARHLKHCAKARVAPGQFKRHYRPRTPLHLFASGTSPSLTARDHKVKVAWVTLCRQSVSLPTGNRNVATFWLSKSGDLNEAAHNLFALLHHLDAQSYQAIYLEKMPAEGIGIAINDRLERAAAS